MLQTERGFTLIEALFALSILSIILLLIPRQQVEQIEKLELQHFFDTLEMDVLYLQSTAGTQENDIPYVLKFNPDSYSIVLDRFREIKREYPAQFSLVTSFPKNVEFYISGVIKNPQTIRVSLAGEPYQIVFPLGKGRYYVEKR
ncbi:MULTISPECIES: competence type IV pilus minor pilin ComGD [Oceanobacillus]|uniref:Competence type IV pilus minor pilin ComGD n=1 Tax=Oceanobacillus aidingensis TaxID=645964 RepID=A0ABV9K440_9BACI|nr:competence type IV pilus minor pilin ComGD [Oceanobacillus oncorhynchi]MDM8099425.1 competence type IV pilus minor pilin ComGD [Oceanobacillus oncorhynchi]UUI38451.1 competence type IV pilus minor pilin ComGD [Oceanobacillus oncorhynchi]